VDGGIHLLPEDVPLKEWKYNPLLTTLFFREWRRASGYPPATHSTMESHKLTEDGLVPFTLTISFSIGSALRCKAVPHLLKVIILLPPLIKEFFLHERF
jgi:hypothetical protein